MDSSARARRELPAHPPVRTYKVRRRVTSGQADALHRLLPRFGVPADRPFDARRVFGREAPLVLEIGSGMGEATAAMAAADPGRDVLAVEVHTPGLGNLLRLVETAGLTNVRVLEADAREVLAGLLPSASLDEVRIYFPDPWPKARHAKRRLVTPALLDLAASRLRPGGRLHVATDWVDYAEQVRHLLRAHPGYERVDGDRGSRPVTRFEQRGRDAGRPVHDVVAHVVAHVVPQLVSEPGREVGGPRHWPDRPCDGQTDPDGGTAPRRRDARA